MQKSSVHNRELLAKLDRESWAPMVVMEYPPQDIADAELLSRWEDFYALAIEYDDAVQMMRSFLEQRINE